MSAGRVAAFLISFLLAVAPGTEALGQAQVGVAKRVVGDVFGNTLDRILEPGETLIKNQRVSTGVESATDLSLVDNTTLTLGERAQVILDDVVVAPRTGHLGGTLEVSEGLLRFASGGPVDLTLKTHLVSIGIRGTRFDVLATGEATEIAVFEGTVTATSASGTDTVTTGQVYRVENAPAGGVTAAFRSGVSPEMHAARAKMLALLGPSESEAQSLPAQNERSDTMTLAAAKATAAFQKAVKGRDKGNLLIVETTKGVAVIALRPDLAPKTVARMKDFAKRKVYDGIAFHSVRPGFAAETGDPTGTGTGGFGTGLRAELSDAPFVRGAVGMKHLLGKPDTAGTQFFIVTGDANHLNGEYALFGDVIYGLEAIDKLAAGSPAADPDRILHMRVGSAALK